MSIGSVRTEPLLVSNDERSGPGGPAPFVDRDGLLRLGYHGWKPPYTTYPPYPECRAGTPRGCEDGQRFLFIDILCTAGTDLFVLNPREGARFCDVAGDAYYANPVAYLHDDGVLPETLCEAGFCPSAPVDRLFCPSRNTTRGQMATFLHRAQTAKVPVP